MSNITHRIPQSTQIGEHRRAVLAALLALLATTAVVLTLVLAGGESDSPENLVAPASVSAARFGAPDEARVAAAISPKTAPARPDESAIASAISGPVFDPAPSRPDESRVAAAIGSGPDSPTTQSRPDESAVAASISGR